MVLDLKVELIRLAADRIKAGITELKAIALEELARRSMDDLTAGRIATVADKLETVVAVLNETILSRHARQAEEPEE